MSLRVIPAAQEPRTCMILGMKQPSLSTVLVLGAFTTFVFATICAREVYPQQGSHNLTNDDSKNDKKLPAAIALRMQSKPDEAGFPEASAWLQAPAIQFSCDWQGKNCDTARETEVRILWTADFLYLKFLAKYRNITVFPDARPDGWRDKLWDRDVAEVFLQPDSSDPFRYKEFEVSPNGFWIDLNISHGELAEMKSGLKRRMDQDPQNHFWMAELCIPMKSLTANFDPARGWRVNFFRVEGDKEPRFYSAWSPTNSPEPNFHVPSAFRKLAFRDSTSISPANY